MYDVVLYIIATLPITGHPACMPVQGGQWPLRIPASGIIPRRNSWDTCGVCRARCLCVCVCVCVCRMKWSQCLRMASLLRTGLLMRYANEQAMHSPS